jgi:hypothetical protein
MLYSDDATIATIAGKAYCISKELTGFVPSSSAACLLLIFIVSYFLRKGNKKSLQSTDNHEKNM